MRLSNNARPPVWFMRQAGRYHSHYRALRKEHSFERICRTPALACEAALGPIRDFDFDAAILFSDILFILEAMGMDLAFSDAGPKLGRLLENAAAVARLRTGDAVIEKLSFQAEAARLVRRQLPPEKTLIGFAGAPLTLFFFAAAGSHKGEAVKRAVGIAASGALEPFLAVVSELLLDVMKMQADAGADVFALFDSCAGDIPEIQYSAMVMPALKKLISRFKSERPDTNVIYYAKGLSKSLLEEAALCGADCIGIDDTHDLPSVLISQEGKVSIQGNFSPQQMLLPPGVLEPVLRAWLARTQKVPASARKGWVCGLGHGVLPGVPEENVRLFLRLQRAVLGTC
ncbi:MAG: hypothetical protein A2583_07535 [Bdellovibrionales bacterium RIFOXYD1_FULL_53_11]|nr:MAG: hypothetical protein A2583_07535 [Bdellovibrionales bacterium RIFOXYD1_FULL_53_11]